MTLEKLQPANPRDVSVYAPYYQGRKRSALPLAISLYQIGSLEGSRKIEGGESIPFVASWSISSIPADLTRCRMQFDGNAELSYEVTMANFEFVDFLIEVLFIFKSTRAADFSQAFYRKLLRLDD
ncbi:MAG TPA: type IV pilus biogenesis protein EbsA [Allocoleopsis sp.]